MVDIGIIFAGVSFVKELAGYLGIIESLDVKIDKIGKAELNAGLLTLKQIETSESEKVHLLRDASRFFTKAITIENGERLIAAYIGLAFCQNHLGERKSCIVTLRQVLNLQVNNPITRKVIETAEDAVALGPPFTFSPLIVEQIRKLTGRKSLSKTYFDNRQKRFDDLKLSIMHFLEITCEDRQ